MKHGKETPEKKPLESKPTHELRTLYTDTAQVKGTYDSGTMAKFLQVERQRAFEKAQKKAVKEGNSAWGLLSIFLAVTGVIVLVITLYTVRPRVFFQSNLPDTIIQIDSSGTVDLLGLTRQNIIAGVHKSKENLPVSPKSIHNYLFSSEGQRTDLRAFFSALNIEASPFFFDTATGEYVFGVITTEKKPPFLLFTTKSFTQSLTVMREFEETLYTNLGGLFIKDINGLSSDKGFVDGVLDNRPARIMQLSKKNIDSTGSIQQTDTETFFYMFIDEQTVLIAADENVINEIVSRYTE